MMCHGIEAARFLVADPEKRKDSVVAHTVAAEIASLKWTRPEYIQRLKEMTNGKIDYTEHITEVLSLLNMKAKRMSYLLCRER